MRKILLSIGFLAATPIAVASAADMPLKAPPAVAATVFSWTGFYIGAEVGGGVQNTSSVRNVGNSFFPVGFSTSSDPGGAYGGFEAGANYQFRWLVLGVEGDWQATSFTIHSTDLSPLKPGDYTVGNRETEWVSTVTGRAGLAFDRWMVFGKGGAAWRRLNDSADDTTFNPAGGLISHSITNASTETGYVVGGGVEWAPWDQISFKVEGDWYNFGNQASAGSTTVSCGAGAAGCVVGAVTAPGETTTSPTMWEVKAAMNLRFNWPPLGH